jgi:predicted chitinase
MMCEVEETMIITVPGGGTMCTAPAWVEGMGYPGGSVVSFEGKEYTARYWADHSPATTSGSDPGDAWYEGVDCPGGGDSTEEVVTTTMVCCDTMTTPDPPVGGGGCALDAILGEAEFNKWFQARRNPFYTYANLCTALEDFPGFANGSDDTANKREVAAFFANVARETGELDYIEQFPESRGSTGNYFGRGPIQLTWDYNYSDAGDAIGVDLLGNPDLVATDGVVTWQSALWFWMLSDGAAKGTCHAAITAGDFGQTINIINGGLECNAGNAAALQRIGYYETYCANLGVDPGTSLTCW